MMPLELSTRDLNTFYIDVPKADALNLVVMLLVYRASLSEWDKCFGEGKFLIELAKLLIA